MTITITKEMVLFALAIYGALLSTWNLVKAIRRDQRTVKVTAGTKVPVFQNGQLGTTWAHIEATNIGQRAVTITMIAFELRPGVRIFNMQANGIPGMEDTELPATLADGQTARFHQSYADIGYALMSNGQIGNCRITPMCEDSAGGIHRGEAWDVNCNELTRM